MLFARKYSHSNDRKMQMKAFFFFFLLLLLLQSQAGFSFVKFQIKTFILIAINKFASFYDHPAVHVVAKPTKCLFFLRKVCKIGILQQNITDTINEYDKYFEILILSSFCLEICKVGYDFNVFTVSLCKSNSQNQISYLIYSSPQWGEIFF